MKINLQDLTKKIEQEDYLQDLITVKYAEISKSKAKLKEAASKMVKETAAAIKHHSLSHIALEITGQRPVTFALETNIINLPYSNYKKVANFFDNDKDYPVYIYFETISNYLNASGFRIDQLATEGEIVQDEAAVVTKLLAELAAKIKQVREYEKPAPAPVKKAAKKPAAKKVTKKKATKAGNTKKK
ncbi:hypothetical protein OZY43_07025 [Lactobacillus sp. ESL0785]|uniref:hypothetical protein n=1 Tax=Lactobacillus sp. ESL0785 TaxID=2983232 RepID=UPI0023F9BA24|nr:hypothetical protein [Lactobacillus sp. ESL0785]WEV70684.1 hypothetical protein OZY43_07025 [Lactobacillus sp. ESL0785]